MHPPCSYCGNTIHGKYVVDFWGNSYCALHLNTTPQCDYCGRFIGTKSTKGGKSYQDGRQICGICLKDSVNTPRDGLKILEEVHDFLEISGIKIRPFKPDFALIDRSKIKQQNRVSPETQGTATFQKEIKNDELISYKMEIFILDGLPRVNFISTSAHELMHIWFYSQNITDASPALVEGSCNMASYLVLKSLKTLEAEYLIKGLFSSKSKIYGSGFRKVQKLAEKRGTLGWLEFLRTHKQI